MKKRTKQRSWDSLEEALRELILETNNIYRVWKDTGVKRQSMMRLVRGERSLQLPFADQLARYFNLKIVQEK